MLSLVPRRRRPQGREQRHRRHQEQEDRPVRRLVSNRVQGIHPTPYLRNVPDADDACLLTTFI